MMIRLVTLLWLALLINSCTSQTTKPIQATHNKSRIDSLMAAMTLEEKIGQMTLFTTDWGSTGPTIREGYEEDIRTGKCGALFNSHTAAFTRRLQEIAVKESRLGIPLLFGYDVIHGYKTIFPIPLAESCSWDLQTIEESASIAAREASAAGLHWTFAPMVDISRDPRWGRVMEGAGEDPYLGSMIARARVRGFQGTSFDDADKVVACVKHYAAYGAPVAGRDYNTVDMSERFFREYYLPPYKAGIDEGALTIMTSFNDLDGIPATANKWLLEEILRGEWGFDGFVVTDYTSINEMVNHGYAVDEKHAGELAVMAGVDMDMQGSVFQRFLADQVRSGQVPMAVVDDAVRRILMVKEKLGLFENPYRYSDESREKAEVFSVAHREAARNVARQSMVLLKNDNNTLPLNQTHKRIALVGPLAAERSQLMGAWSGAGEGENCISVLDAFKELSAVKNYTLQYKKGCEIIGDDTTQFTDVRQLISSSDIIIAVMGEASEMSGEAAARADISLPGAQEEFVKMLVATGKPVVVILMNGRPLTFPWIADHADAILEAWWPGTMGGPAIADILFGDYNPSAKLTMTFPRHVGQIPIYYNQKNTGRPFDPDSKWNTKYLDMPNSPQYPFGFGMSYTTFAYEDFKLSRESFSMGDEITCSINVRNTGTREGEEVVQLYIRDLVGSVTRPVKELKGFQKIKLRPGEAKNVIFKLTSNDLAFYTADMSWTAEPGEFMVMIGPDSERVQQLKLTLVSQ